MIAHILALTLLPLLLILAAVWDLTSYTIPNRLTLAIMALFAVFAVILPIGWAAAGTHVLCGLVALGIGILLFSLGWIGGGDAKLFAASALWLGWPDVLQYTLMSALMGGALTLVLLLFRKNELPAILMNIKWIQKLHHPKSGIPYGIALAAGFLVVLPQASLLS